MDLDIVWGGETHPFDLEDGEYTVGRAGDNDIKVLSGRVSKRHAIVRVDGDRLFVRDLGSTNGTEVDGTRVGPEEIEVAANSAVNFAGATMHRRGMSSTSIDNVLGGRNDVSTVVRYNLMREGFSNKARDRIVDLSSGMFELLASEREAIEVQKAACEFVSKCVSADRVVLLEDQGEATKIDVRARWTSHHHDKNVPLQLSYTVVDQVLKQRDSVLLANPLEDPRYAAQQSIMALHLRSAMAAPLFDNERVRGILYVDTADASVQYSQDDLQVLTATANAVAVKLRNLTLESELSTAAQIQRSMLPQIVHSPPGYELDAHQLMCRQVGGDLYHCLRRPNGRTLLALGDVSGKGMPAALAMAAATVLISMLAEIGGEVEQVIGHLHEQLCKSLGEDQFITLFLGELESETGKLRYINAGHEPPILYRADGSLERLESTGLAVAMIEGMVPDAADVTLHPGDFVSIFSDGIPEATTDGSRFLDLEPVLEILEKNRHAELASIRDKIMVKVVDFLDGEPTSDDVTLMLLRRQAG
jgi:serine phosphatase RsbU (regulator of sigma subunit)